MFLIHSLGQIDNETLYCFLLLEIIGHILVDNQCIKHTFGQTKNKNFCKVCKSFLQLFSPLTPRASYNYSNGWHLLGLSSLSVPLSSQNFWPAVVSQLQPNPEDVEKVLIILMCQNLAILFDLFQTALHSNDSIVDYQLVDVLVNNLNKSFRKTFWKGVFYNETVYPVGLETHICVQFASRPSARSLFQALFSCFTLSCLPSLRGLSSCVRLHFQRTPESLVEPSHV